MGKCTIYFEDPFWVGIFERTEESGYRVARHVFGTEPGQAEILAFAHSQFHLLAFSHPDPYAQAVEKPESYKHRQHRIRHEAAQTGAGTKAQQAIKAEKERSVQESRKLRKVGEEQAAEDKFQLQRVNRLEKRRGH